MAADTNRFSASSDIIEHSAQTSSVIAFGTGHNAHWALFVPNRQASPMGTLIHVGYNQTSRIIKEAKLLIDTDFALGHSSAKRVTQLHDAQATCEQVKEVAEEVYSNNFNYNIVLDNCQNFTMKVLTRLHKNTRFKRSSLQSTK